MRKWLVTTGALLAACVCLLAATAGAATVKVGKLVIHADGSFEPRALPKWAFAPIRFRGYGEIDTTDGSLPPAAKHLEAEFDHDGRLTTAGLPVCQPAKLEGATTGQARRRCGRAIVGTGNVGATVPLAGFGRVGLQVPLSIFNGPRVDGDPTAILHARAPFPISETYVIVAPIERRRGLYGYRTAFDIPPIAGGAGTLTYIDVDVGRRYRAGGVEHSYVSARCSDYILQVRGYISFADGTIVYGSFFKACHPKP